MQCDSDGVVSKVSCNVGVFEPLVVATAGDDAEAVADTEVPSAFDSSESVASEVCSGSSEIELPEQALEVQTSTEPAI